MLIICHYGTSSMSHHYNSVQIVQPLHQKICTKKKKKINNKYQVFFKTVLHHKGSILILNIKKLRVVFHL